MSPSYDLWKTTNPADDLLGPDPDEEPEMTVPARTTAAVAPTGDIMESLLLKGDLGKLTPQERVSYYSEVCKSVGLNPLTKPFEYITLNGKLTLYALRSCTDQLRKINGVSLEIVSRDVADDILTVHVRAKMPDGRIDEDLGTVPFSSMLKGDARANMELKCITKAKRRVTLSICGLGWLDETEVDSIPASAKSGPRRAAQPAPNVMRQPRQGNTVSVAGGVAYDANTGEVYDDQRNAAGSHADSGDPVASQPAAEAVPAQSQPLVGTASDPESPPMSEQIQAEYTRCEAAAEEGMTKLRAVWNTVPPVLRGALENAKERRWKPRAAEVDAANQSAIQ